MSLSSEVRMVLIILAVSDLPRAVKFYQRAFDWPQRVAVPVYAEFEMASGQRLGLYERESFGHNTGQIPIQVPDGELAGTEIYFYADDIPAVIARLEAAGARKLNALRVREWGDEAAYFADPDGNILVVARPMMK